MKRSALQIAWGRAETEGRPEMATLQNASPPGGKGSLHVAIIMDGNGRWAERKGQPRLAGHVAGTAVVRKIVEAAPRLRIKTLTLYAFSSDNWRRPRQEVTHLMGLFRKYLDAECRRLQKAGIRLTVIGRRDRLSTALLKRIAQVEAATSKGAAMQLRVAIDYSARESLLAAAARMAIEGVQTRQRFEQCLSEEIHDPNPSADVDLLIRTGGEKRLSDFLLWESAYAEFLFSDVLWPDFRARDLGAAVAEFSLRERRFGGLSSPSSYVKPTSCELRSLP